MLRKWLLSTVNMVLNPLPLTFVFLRITLTFSIFLQKSFFAFTGFLKYKMLCKLLWNWSKSNKIINVYVLFYYVCDINFKHCLINWNVFNFSLNVWEPQLAKSQLLLSLHFRDRSQWYYTFFYGQTKIKIKQYKQYKIWSYLCISILILNIDI